MHNELFLQNFNWQRDQGIQLNMINSVTPIGRNQFYDQMLQKYVKNQMCVEIGFGTGILSMLAIKHGAKHVTAWEQDENRYLLGRYIIRKLGLQQQITLFHGAFNNSDFPNLDAVVFHEIIGPNVWNEGLRTALPLKAKTILPAKIKVEFDVVQISKQDYTQAFFPQRRFCPEVECLPGFETLLQELIDSTPQKNHPRETFINGLIPNQFLSAQDFYTIDFARQEIDQETFEQVPEAFEKNYDFDVPTDQVWLLFPCTSILHDDQKLHWCWYKPIMVESSGNYDIFQNFTTGEFNIAKLK